MNKKPPVVVIPSRPATAVPLPAKKPTAVPIEIPGTGALAIFAERAEEAAEKAEAAAEKVEHIGEALESGKIVTDISETPNGFEAEKGNGEKVEIKLVKSVNGQKPDEAGNIFLPFPITVKVLGDSDI